MGYFLQKSGFAVSLFIILLSFQMIYSFLSPAVGSEGQWPSPSSYISKFSAQTSDNFLLGKISPLISKYRLANDTGHYIEWAGNFNSEFSRKVVIIERPLYSLLIFFTSLPARIFTPPSYGITFVSAILLNFISAVLTVFLFFKLLGKIFSPKIAYLSSILLIFSPFFRIYLIQATPEAFSVFEVVASFYLLYNYLKKPSLLKLIIFSLIIGTLLLGKMFLSISLFIALAAIYFRRYREGAIFLAVHSAPFFLWVLWLTQVWHIPYYSHEIQTYHAGVWLFNVFYQPQAFQILAGSIPIFFGTIITSFLFIPLVFSVIGFRKLKFRHKNLLCFGYIFSVFILSFLIGQYYNRLTFTLFLIVYPTAVLGVDTIALWLKRFRGWYAPAFYVITIGLFIFMASINSLVISIYKIFNY